MYLFNLKKNEPLFNYNYKITYIYKRHNFFYDLAWLIMFYSLQLIQKKKNFFWLVTSAHKNLFT